MVTLQVRVSLFTRLLHQNLLYPQHEQHHCLRSSDLDSVILWFTTEKDPPQPSSSSSSSCSWSPNQKQSIQHSEPHIQSHPQDYGVLHPYLFISRVVILDQLFSLFIRSLRRSQRRPQNQWSTSFRTVARLRQSGVLPEPILLQTSIRSTCTTINPHASSTDIH